MSIIIINTSTVYPHAKYWMLIFYFIHQRHTFKEPSILREDVLKIVATGFSTKSVEIYY